MIERPYAVLVEAGTTRFVLPRRARTLWRAAGGWGCILLSVAILLVAAPTIWQWIQHGVMPRGEPMAWVIGLGIAAVMVPAKVGWELLKRGQAELRVDVANDEMHVIHRTGDYTRKLGQKEEWGRISLTEIAALQVEDDDEKFMPKENAFLWALRTDDSRMCIVRSYPRWLLEELAADLEELIREANPA